MTLPPELVALPDDERDAVLALAVEIVRSPQPIEGLTAQQAKLVRMLQAVAPRRVPYPALAGAIQHRDRADPINPNTVATVITQIGYRRPDIRACIGTSGYGRAPGEAWWTA